MDRREFMRLSVGAAAGVAGFSPQWGNANELRVQATSFTGPTSSVIPVVGDGRWIWTEPPAEETGYLEPRSFRLSIGIEVTGRGSATQIKATTPVPVECPEQKIDQEEVRPDGCEAQVRSLGPHARQLCLAAAAIGTGQKITATATFDLTLFKQYQDYQADDFPEQQEPPADVRKQYLGESPGIQTRDPLVRKLLEQLRTGDEHPWDLAQKFAAWIRGNIEPRLGSYTSVSTALKDRQGDCEEMSAVFVALCRAAGVPARLVWIPNHNWAEFCLVDRDAQPQWIPAHIACYSWFGWTGVHELVLQKGDRIRIPERAKYQRLLDDWLQWSGTRPDVRYLAELTPLSAKDDPEAGPGARRKIATGEWQLDPENPLNKYARR